jgi:hypothetical protein
LNRPDPALSETLAEESPSLQAALADLRALLVEGEGLQACVAQHRIFALTHRRVVVGATTGRLIILQRRLLGGYQPQDIRWQDLKEVSLDVGIFGADLLLVAARGADLAGTDQGTRSITVQGLRKDPAAAVYRICQAQEQAWRERRRVREIEELRAKSGGIAIGGAAIAPESLPSPSPGETPAARLERAREMLAKGLISDSEYESIKAKIVSGL